MGSVEDAKAYKFKADQKWIELKTRKPLSETTVTTSNSRSNFIQENYIKYMNAKNIQAGGAGRKVKFSYISDHPSYTRRGRHGGLRRFSHKQVGQLCWGSYCHGYGRKIYDSDW